MHVSKYRPVADLSCHPPRVLAVHLDDLLANQLIHRLLIRLHTCGYDEVVLDLGQRPELCSAAITMMDELADSGLEITIAVDQAADRAAS